MRTVIQRVKKAQVFIENQLYSEIGAGLLILLGIHKNDTDEQVKWLVNKIIHLRIFNDDEGKMNRSIKEAKGEVLVVSQFTLYANYQSGRRPDFFDAAGPEVARPLYQKFIDLLSREMGEIRIGVFGAFMQISLINDGPVTLVIDSEKRI